MPHAPVFSPSPRSLFPYVPVRESTVAKSLLMLARKSPGPPLSGVFYGQAAAG